MPFYSGDRKLHCLRKWKGHCVTLIKEKKIIFFVRRVLCNFHHTDNISLINISVDIKLTYGVCKVLSLRHSVTVSVKRIVLHQTVLFLLLPQVPRIIISSSSVVWPRNKTSKIKHKCNSEFCLYIRSISAVIKMQSLGPYIKAEPLRRKCRIYFSVVWLYNFDITIIIVLIVPLHEITNMYFNLKYHLYSYISFEQQTIS